MRIKVNRGTDDLDGLFMYLFTNFSKNYIHKIINVTASSSWEGRGLPINVLDPTIDKENNTLNWISKNEENSNFTITFLHHQFAIDSYTLQSRLSSSSHNPVQWIVEATNDMINWVKIHEHPFGDELTTQGAIKNYQCPKKEFFSSFRITQTGENSNTVMGQSHLLSFGQIEFFGALYGLFFTKCRKRFIDIHSSLFIIIPTAFSS